MDKWKLVNIISIGFLFFTIPLFTLGIAVDFTFTIIGWFVVILQFIWLGLVVSQHAYKIADRMLDKYGWR